MDALEERIAVLVREQQGALCIECLAAETHTNPHRVHSAVGGLALLDEFSYAVACSRCGTDNSRTLIVGPHRLDQTA